MSVPDLAKIKKKLFKKKWKIKKELLNNKEKTIFSLLKSDSSWYEFT